VHTTALVEAHVEQIPNIEGNRHHEIAREAQQERNQQCPIINPEINQLKFEVQAQFRQILWKAIQLEIAKKPVTRINRIREISLSTNSRS
jgi:hypothetical protein